jgi:prevent-host-death family protein
MRTIAAAKFKAECLAILDDVDPEGIIITKRGKPVAKLVPVHETSANLIGILQGKLGPVDPNDDLLSTGIKWDADDPDGPTLEEQYGISAAGARGADQVSEGENP